MKIIVRTKNIKLTQSLRNYIKEKINSLEKFAQDFFGKEYFKHLFEKGKPKIEAWVEVGKITQHHQKGKIFWAECQMRFPGKSLRAAARSKDLKQSIVEVKDILQKQVKEYKGKMEAEAKRNQRKLKRKLKIAPGARLYRKNRIREEGI